MKTCTKCKLVKPDSEFSFRNKALGKLSCACKICHNVYNTSHYKRNSDVYKKRASKNNLIYREINRKKLLAYLEGKHCADCPENDPIVLQFDHVRGKKRQSISRMMLSCNWETILEEIAKCDIRCANCHLRRTSDSSGWFKSRNK